MRQFILNYASRVLQLEQLDAQVLSEGHHKHGDGTYTRANRAVYAESEGEFTKQWPLYGEEVDYSRPKRQVNGRKNLRNTFMRTSGALL